MPATQPWKVSERKHAKMFLGPDGVRVVRHRGGKSKDFGDAGILSENKQQIIPSPWIRLESKYRQHHGVWAYWEQAHKLCTGRLIPVVALAQAGSPRTLVVLDYVDVSRMGAYLTALHTGAAGPE